jgi:predicted glycosyltransferase
VRLVQLPPARAAGPGFRPIVGEDGREIDSAWKKRRAAATLALFAELRPDALVVETYPFGRKPFRFELEPLLEIAGRRQPRPVIAASVRDILAGGRTPEREAGMAAAARKWLDLVLVHGDPALIPFEATFPPAPAIADLVRYTGLVAGSRRLRAAPTPAGRGEEIVVSVGGGAVGSALLETALAAALLLAPPRPWRLLAGAGVPEAVFRRMQDTAGPGVTIERARPDFPALLETAALSISQAGYNTVLDVLVAGCPAILVPFAGPGGETEQPLRARLLAERGLVRAIAEADLTPALLAREAAAALAAGPAPAALGPARLDGAAASARMILEAVAAHDAKRSQSGGGA